MLCEYVLGSGTECFNKHLAKKYGITKETHAASVRGTISGSRQTQLGGWTMEMPGRGMPFNYNRNISFLMSFHLTMVKVRL